MTIEKDGLKKFIMLNIGCLIAAIPLVFMFKPANTPPGGLMSIAMMICKVMGWNADKVNPGDMSFLLNIPLLIISLYVFGKGYFAKTAYASLAYPAYVSILIKTISYLDITVTAPHCLITVIFGGALQGFGVALAMASGASTGGTDIIAQMINHFKPLITIGVALALANGLILVTAASIYGLAAATSGIAIMLITSFVVDTSLKHVFKIDHF